MAEQLIKFEPGDTVKASETNANNDYLENKITIGIASLDKKIEGITSNVSSQIQTALGAVNAIGQPIIRMNDVLNGNEIRLEGAEVSKTTYAALYEVYGDKYGTSTDSSKFVLPDYRNRTFWGTGEDGDFGLVEAGLPNIEGYIQFDGTDAMGNVSGAFSVTSSKGTGNYHHTDQSNVVKKFSFDASQGGNEIYGNSDTVQPAAIKIRVVTRYK